ncbi:MAG: phosphatase PAP2 family protein [Actinobacteria bacterium]|nr:phosphatase PAP2 family protein [Actinomycetota bacterium]
MPSLLAVPRACVSLLDERLDAALDQLRGHPVADRVFYSASELGDFSLLWLILGAARGLRSEQDERAAVRLGIGALIETTLVNGLIKSLFRRKRPPWDAPRAYRIRRPLTSSFPSGHATSAFCLAILLAEDDPLAPLYYGLAVIVATSRAYVKIHHASDVLAGVGLGVGLGLLGRRMMPLEYG